MVSDADGESVARAYALVWGPWHGLKAAAGLPRQREWNQLGPRVRGLLTHVPYLQSAIRAQAAFARAKGQPSDAQALRETFIAADALTSGTDTEQPLRHRIEGHLVEWHHYLDEGSLQVGGLLCNMLGADEEAKAHAHPCRFYR